MDARTLDGLSRSDLIAHAETLGVEKASVLTRAELMDEIVRRTVTDPFERRVARGLLGLARDLVARVVERGLHLPDAAALIRGHEGQASAVPVKAPIATVTLAEIYATQGHRARALSVLDEVLVHEPDHGVARQLRGEIAAKRGGAEAVAVDAAKSAAAEPVAVDAAKSAAAEPVAVDAAKSAAGEGAATAPIAAEADGGITIEDAFASGREITWPGDDPDDDATGAKSSALDGAGPVQGDVEAPPDARESAPEQEPLETSAVARSVELLDTSAELVAETAPADSAPANDDAEAPVSAPDARDHVAFEARDPGTLFVSWAVRRATFDDVLRLRGQRGSLVLRIVAVTASWDGPAVETRDVDIAGLIGGSLVGSLPAGAVVRAAVGWRTEKEFEPLSLGPSAPKPAHFADA